MVYGSATQRLEGGGGFCHGPGRLRWAVGYMLAFVLTLLPAPGAEGGFTWFTDAVNINPSTTGSWQDIDLSAIVPADATGVVVEFDNTADSDYRAVVRGKEDTRDYMSNASYNTIKVKRSRFQIVKLDASRFIEGWITNQNVDIWLRGYTTGGDPSYFDVPPEITPSAGSWQPIDVTGQVDAGADGVILFIASQDASSRTYAIREVGSTDQQTPAYGLEQYGDSMYLVGLNAAKQFEANIQATTVKIYLVAQTKGSVVYYTNDTALPDISSWVSRDADDFSVPEGANGLIFYSYNTSTTNRRNQAYFHGDSTQTYRGNLGYQGPNATQSATGLNDANVWKQFQEASTIDAYIAAYTTGGYRMATGTYVGDGVDNRAISGVGFQPDVVFVKANAGDSTVCRISTMVGDLSKPMVPNFPVGTNRIQSLDADGFTVGTLGQVNSDGTSYYWVAFKAAAGALDVGTYVGDSNDNRSIGGVGFQPDYVIIFGETGDANGEAYQRFSSMVGDTSITFSTDGPTSNRIQAFEADGFQLGKFNVNKSGVTYHYAAWKAIAGQMNVASYTGDGSDDRSISGVGFKPDYVIIKDYTTGHHGFHRPASLAGDSTLWFTSRFNDTNLIQALEADGFQLGNAVAGSGSVNNSGDTYHWAAFFNPGGSVPVPVLTLSDHDPPGQETDAFSDSGNETDAELFAFKLDPGPDTISVTELVFSLSNIANLADLDWVLVEVAVDDNGDGTIDGSETDAVGGGGTVSGSTITFSSSFPVSSATNYILRADFPTLANCAKVTIALNAADVQTTEVVSGSTTSVSHQEGTGCGSGTWMEVGSYTGNGTTLAITDVGFQPDVVIVKGDTTKNAFLRSSTMTGDATKQLVSNNALQSGLIQSLDALGFTVGSTNGDVNQAGITYYWVAFKITAGQVDVGSYPGDGADNRSVGGVGFQPDYLIVMSDGARNVWHRSSTMVGDFSLKFSNQASSTNMIQAFESNGFQVGSNNQVNNSSETFHYVAFKSTAGQISVGSYPGDGADDRGITDVGFQPDYLILKGNVAFNGAHRTNLVAGDSTLDFKNVANYANGIQALQANGFQVGTNIKVNQSGKTFYWMAFADGAASPPKPKIIKWVEVDPYGP